jgi:hypothetical protein
MKSCAAVAKRRRLGANRVRASIDDRPQLAKLPHNSAGLNRGIIAILFDGLH